MADDLRHRIGRLFYAQDQPIEYMRPIPWEDAWRRVPAKYTHCMKMADAAIAACDPIDTATGRTWKERFLERDTWLPMETAPRDGTPVDLWLDFFFESGAHEKGNRVPNCYWDSADNLWRHDGTGKVVLQQAAADDGWTSLLTGWMHVPVAPSPPDKRQAKEPWDGKERRRRGERRSNPPSIAAAAALGRRISRGDRRKAQPETSEVK